MGQKKQGQAVQEFRCLTERMRGHRVRIRTEFIPELVSWLMMMGERYTRTRTAAAREHKDSSDEYMASVMIECQRYEDVIQQVINCCPDPFGVGRWEDVTTRIAAEMGVVIGVDLPPTIRDDARDIALPTEG